MGLLNRDISVWFLFFFFQAEDGIRDHCVTGVQTCALPIWLPAGTCRFPRLRKRLRGALGSGFAGARRLPSRSKIISRRCILKISRWLALARKALKRPGSIS